MNKIMKMVCAWMLTVVVLCAQTPTKLVDGPGNELQLAAGGKYYNSGMILLTTSPVAFTTITTKAQLIFCGNETGSTVTVTITDNSGTPIKYFTAVAMAANSSMLLHASAVGLPFASGIKLQASATNSISCQVVGVQ